MNSQGEIITQKITKLLATPAQKRIYQLEQLEKDSLQYNNAYAFYCEGELNAEKLKSSLEWLTAHHSSLRTFFQIENGELYQYITDEICIDFEYGSCVEGEVESLLKEFKKPFELNCCPLFRSRIINLEKNINILLFDFHHIISDGTTLGILFSQLSELYAGKTPKLQDVDYEEYTSWINSYKVSEEYGKQKDYWLERLEGYTPLNIPIKQFDDETCDSALGEIYTYHMDHLLNNEIESYCKRKGITIYMFMLSIFNILLAKVCGQSDVVIGTPISGRSNNLFKDIVGMFVNTIVMRNNIADELEVGELLEEICENILDSFDNTEFQYDELVNILRNKDENSSIFNTMFTLEVNEVENLQLLNINIKALKIPVSNSKFNLTLAIKHYNDEFILSFEYDKSLLDGNFVMSLGECFENIVLEVLNNDTKKIQDIKLINSEMESKILRRSNGLTKTYAFTTVKELFEDTVIKNKDNYAIVVNNQRLTYKELNDKANALALILSENNIQTGDVVGVICDRTSEMIVAILAVIKVGGVYLPIDIDQPINRIEFMLGDSGSSILIGSENTLSSISIRGVNQIRFSLNSLNNETKNPYTELDEKAYAYVIYTSGSTGEPKGSKISNIGLINLVNGLNDIEVNENDAVLQAGSFSFDASVFQMWMALLHGARLHIERKELLFDGNVLENYLVDNNITFMLIPTILYNNLAFEFPRIFNSLRYMLIGGDVISKKAAYLIYKNNKTIVQFNAYGPTENAVISTIFKIPREQIKGVLPIGTPIVNTMCYILDPNLKLIPDGIVGELFVGGIGLADAYINRNTLSEEKFITNPYNKDEILYRTGDLCKWNNKGEIEFVGRKDYQTKIRGYRVELGEIERQLETIDTIKQSVVVEMTGENKEKNLCAYIVSKTVENINNIKEKLRGNLPNYMIPNYIVQLPELPLTVNGKIDRKKLPHPSKQISSVKVNKINSMLDEKVLHIFKEVLGCESLTEDENFFDKGGDSIKAIIIASRLIKSGIHINAKDILSFKYLKDIPMIHKSKGIIAEQDIVERSVLFSPIQRELIELEGVEYAHFAQCILIAFTQEVGETEIVEAFNQLILHHDVLRTKINVDKKTSHIVKDLQSIYRFNNWDYTSKLFNNNDLKNIIGKLDMNMNIENGPLIYLDMIKSKERTYLHIAIHHHIIDGVSWRILLEDLKECLINLNSSRVCELGLKTTSFPEWIEGLRHYGEGLLKTNELQYWTNIINSETDPFPKKTDTEIYQYCEMGKEICYLSSDITNKLLYKINYAYNTEINDILLTALGISMKKWKAVSRFLVLLEGHGREYINDNVDVSRTIGWFTSRYPILLSVGNDLENNIVDVKEMVRSIPRKGIGYGILKNLIEDTQLFEKVDISLNYLGEFSYLNNKVFETISMLEDLSVNKTFKTQQSIEINIFVIEGRLAIDIRYAKDEYSTSDIIRLNNILTTSLEEIVEFCSKKEVVQLTSSDYGNNNLSHLQLQNLRKYIEYNYDGNCSVEKINSLSSMQMDMVFTYLKDKDSKAYNSNITVPVNRNINPSHLELALNNIVRQHESLRTIIYKGNEDFYQVVLSHSDFKMEFYTELSFSKGIHMTNPIDLFGSRLFQCVLIEKSDHTFELCLLFHHIILDGWSIQVLLKELQENYYSIIGYKNLVEIDRFGYSNYLKNNRYDLAEASRYWINYLKDYNSVVSLPRKRMERNSSYSKKSFNISLDKKLYSKMKVFTSRNSLSMNCLCSTVWGILLQKYNNVNDVVYTSIISGRDETIENIENLVGLFINAIIIRIKSKSEETALELLHRIQKDIIERKPYENIPLVYAKEMLGSKEDPLRTLMAYENYPITTVKDDIFDFNNLQFEEQTNYDFNISFVENENLNIYITYNNAIYEGKLIENITKELCAIFELIVNNSSLSIGALNLFSAKKITSVLEINNSPSLAPENLKDVFEHTAITFSDRVAVINDNKLITYKELNGKSNDLAMLLIQKGVKKGDVVGIICDRSIETIISMIAVIKAGATYLSIDEEMPNKKIIFMIEDSGSNYLLGNLKLLENLKLADVSTISVCMEELDENKPNINMIVNKNDIAYMIYTSGSTGVPKGTKIYHKSLVNLILGIDYIKICEEDSLLQAGSFSFDASIFQIWSTLLNGAKLHIEKKEMLLDIFEAKDYLLNNNITFMLIPTILFNQLALMDQSMFDSLKYLIIGGDVISTRAITNIYNSNKDIILINAYGPTENTVISTVYRIPRGIDITENIPIGQPIRNTVCYVLDENQCLVPEGVAGELCIGGIGLADGYINQKELSNKKFIQNPFSANEMLYRTGDLVKLNYEGDLEFLGRLDYQVKIRGYRVEVEEIIRNIRSYSGVLEAVVIVYAKDDGEKYLCGYIVSNTSIDISVLKNFLKGKIPEYMVPEIILQIPTMPLNVNGKIDRAQLPAPIVERGINEGLYPENEIEEKIAKAYSEVLGIKEINITDNFFHIGGHSLKAVNLLLKLKEEYGYFIKLTDIFDYPSVRELANKVEGETNLQSNNKSENFKRDKKILASSAQRRLYMSYLQKKDSIEYNIPIIMKTTSYVDHHHLETNLNILMNRHEALRTSFFQEEGLIYQKINESLDFEVTEHRKSENDYNIEQIVREFVTPFNLSQAPLMKAHIIRIGNNKTILIFDFHHIVCDGVSVSILLKELKELFENVSLNPDIVQYRSFSEWQNSTRKSDILKLEEEYWVDTFQNDIPVLNFPTDFSRIEQSQSIGKQINFKINNELSQSIRKYASTHGLTFNMVLFAAYNILLSKYSNDEDIIVGIPSSGRNRVEWEESVGMFVNTLPIRSYPAGTKKLLPFLKETRMNILNSLQNQDYQLEDIISKVHAKKVKGHNILFDTMFVFQNYDSYPNEFSNINVNYYYPDLKVSKHDFTLILYDGDEVNCVLNYNAELFLQERMQSFCQHYLNVLLQMIVTDNLEIKDIELCSPEEKHFMIDILNQNKTKYPNHSSIKALFEDNVLEYADKIAITSVHQQIHFSYDELNKKANIYAHYLMSHGVNKGDIVTVRCGKNIETIVTIIAVIKIGAVYVPIDDEYPLERVQYIILDSKSKVVIGKKDDLLKLTNEIGFQKIFIEDMEMCKQNIGNPVVSINSNDLLYIVYTSGTTGNPKGVSVTHKGIVRLVKSDNSYSYVAGDTFLKIISMSFDPSVLEIWGSLLNGMHLLLVNKEIILNLNLLGEVIKEYDVKNMLFPAPLFNKYAIEIPDIFKTLQNIMVGGDVILQKAVNAVLLANPDVAIVNSYGPTENSVVSSYYKTHYNEDEFYNIPIGKPIANSSCYVFDKNLKILPVGILGELCVGGDGVASGYINNEELTNEKFITNPYNGERIYKTGDLVYWDFEGNLRFHGRVDNQIKIRGFRIELDEIKKSLLKIGSIEQVAITLRTLDNNEKELSAFFVSKINLDKKKIRNELAKNLPLYMIPTNIVQLEQIPLTTSGKIDEKELLHSIVYHDHDKVVEVPKGKIEIIVAKIWQSELGVSNISRQDNYFELGGNSLNATIVCAKLRKELEIDLSIEDIFQYPTIEELVNNFNLNKTTQYSKISKVEKKMFYETSAAQKSMYIVQGFDPSSIAFNIPCAWKIKGEIDLEKLENVLKSLIDRNESLKTSFYKIDGQIVQMINDNFEFQIEVIDHENINLQECIKPFQLENAPLFRAFLWKKSELENILLLDMHHIVSDGTSMAIILKDFISIWNEGETVSGLEKVTYKDYSVWHNQLLTFNEMERQENYWLNQLNNLPIVDLVTDYVRPKIQQNDGNTFRYLLNEELTKKIREINQNYHSTLYMTMLSMWNILLSKYSGQEDIVVGSTIAGRNFADLQDIVGMFVNVVVMRNYPKKSKTFSEFLKEVKETSLSAYKNQDFPFYKLVTSLNLKRDSSRKPLFDIFFATNNMNTIELKLDGLIMEEYKLENKISKYDLSLYVTEYNNSIALDIEYSTSLYSEESVKQLLQSYINIIEQVVSSKEDICIKDIQCTTEEQEDRLISLGFPTKELNLPFKMKNHSLLILDQDNKIVPANVIGRLCIVNNNTYNKEAGKIVNESLVHTKYYGYWSIDNKLILKDQQKGSTESTIDKVRRKAKSAPKNSVEKKLIEIWKRIFNEDEIGIHDEYCIFGGSSLKLATQVSDEIIREFGVDITVKDIFNKSTIHNISKLIQKN